MIEEKVEDRSIILPSDGDHTGRTLGEEEIQLLKQVILSGTLNCQRGKFVPEFEAEFAKKYNIRHCCTTSSGTASIHAAVAAINPQPGDEIITSSITDMGAIAPILFQNSIPIFADVEPETYNVTAETIAPKITKRTKAIIVTHLFGNPCDMDPILELASKYGLPVIEDCAQAYLATYKGKLVGTIGAIGCFSLQQTKHITAGEGGMVITNEDAYARKIRLFHDKAWGYGDEKPDHYFLALNYRMTELQGAVALAQLRKLDWIVSNRREMAQLLTEMIEDIKGVNSPKVTPNGKHTYWKYCLQINEDILSASIVEFSNSLKQYGILSSPRYIQKPAFMCQVLKERNTYGTSKYPYEGRQREGEPEVIYDAKDYPGTMMALSRVLVLPWNEMYTERHVNFIAQKLRETSRYFLNRKTGESQG